MRTTRLLCLSTVLGASGLSAAATDFLKIEDFEDIAPGEYGLGALDAQWTLATAEGTAAPAAVVTYPARHDNQTFFADPPMGSAEAFLGAALPAPLDPSDPEHATALIYFQLASNRGHRGFTFWTSSVPTDIVPVVGSEPAQFEVTSAVSKRADLETSVHMPYSGHFTVTNGAESEVETSLIRALEDNRLDVWVFLDATNGTYTVFAKQPRGGQIWHAQLDGGYVRTESGEFIRIRWDHYSFRSDPGTILRSLGFAYSGEDKRGPGQVDDLYIRYNPETYLAESGSTLPVEAELVQPAEVETLFAQNLWYAYDIAIADSAFYWVDTGAWLGWLNIDHVDRDTGNGWIWILNTDSWAYFAAETHNKNGAWIWPAK